MGRAGPTDITFNDSEIVGLEGMPFNPQVARGMFAKGNQSVVFFYKPRLDPELTRQSGRPRYAPKPYVRIAQPGDRDNIVMREVWVDPDGMNPMADNVRFKDLWEKFLVDGESSNHDGTLLQHAPIFSREQVEELRHLNIYTVEQLANMSDANMLTKFGMRALSQLAKDFLEAAKDGSVVTRLHGELEDFKQREQSYLRDKAEQAETIRQLREMLEAQKRASELREVAAQRIAQGDFTDAPGEGRTSEPEPAPKSFLRPKK